jgi:hypothetical protein
MVEVVAIFALLGWLLLTLLEWLQSLSVFPAIVMGFVICPILGVRDYYFVIQTWRLSGMVANREPVPPERFYWSIQLPRLRRRIYFFALCSVLTWVNAATLPASLDATVPSLIGWLNAAVGILAVSRTASTTILFFNASQWFDAMRPNVVGILRRAMYRLSDNYEYLGQKKQDPEKEQVY